MAVTQIRGNTQIIAGSITNTEINASAGIALSKLEALTDADIVVGNGSNVATAVTPSGDITLSNAGVFGITSGAIVNADVNASAALVLSKLESVTSARLIVGSAGNVPTAVDVTGDVTISNAGVTAIGSGVIVNADINGSAAIALSKLAEAVIQADGGQAFTADQSIGGFKLTSLGTPTAATDAATKAYVDATASGLDVKASVRIATIAVLPANTPAGTGVGKTLTASSVGVLTIDSVATVLADRILVKDQAAGDDNGIYEVTTEGTAGVAFILTRATDADQDEEVTAGMFTFVSEGSTLADTGWVLSTNDPITVDTTTLTFTQFSQAGVIEAGAGMTKSGNTLNVITADLSLTVSADNMQVNLDGTAGTLSVGGAGLQIADGTTGEILIGKGGGSDTAFTAITGDIGLTSGGVASIASGVIVDADVNASAAIAYNKLASLTDGNILVGNGSNVATSVNPSGDIDISNAGVFSIATGVIVNADVKSDAAIDYSKLATLTSANFLVGSVGNVATSVTMSGDATLSNAGVLSLASTVLKEADVVTREVPTGDLDGADVTYVLANTPISGTEHVYLNGILQNVGGSNDYTISTNTITFNSAPLSGDIVLASYLK